MDRLLLLAVLLVLLPALASGTDIRVTTLTDDFDTANGTCNLREAIRAANTNTAVDACQAGSGSVFNKDVIYFDVTGRISLINELPSISEELSIIGPGASRLTIDANGFGRVLEIAPASLENQTYVLDGLTLTGGSVTSGSDDGGGLRAIQPGNSNNNTLLVRNVVITGNEVTGDGGGVFVNSGSNFISAFEQVTISDNLAGGNGGGLSVEGAFALRTSTVSGNQAAQGGGLHVDGNALSPTVLDRSTVSGNSATGTGGGIFVEIGDLTLTSATVTNNEGDTSASATSPAGGIAMEATFNDLTLKNTIVAGNTVGAGSFADIRRVSGGVTTLGSNFIGTNGGSTIDFPAGNPNANGDFVGTPVTPLVAGITPLLDFGYVTEIHLPTGDNIIDKGSCAGEAFDQVGRAGTPGVSRPEDRPANANSGDACDIGAVETDADPSPAFMDLTVLLGGAYQDVIMSAGLGSLIPTDQPYSSATWAYNGNEELASPPADMVDWILVRLYSGVPGSLVREESGAYGLDDSGTLITPQNPPDFEVDPGYYYLEVVHRNHVDVTSSVPVRVGWNETSVYDFTKSPTAAAGTNSQQAVAASVSPTTRYALWPGDASRDGAVTAQDALSWRALNGLSLYLFTDMNLDGTTDESDLLLHWLVANGR